MSFRKSGGNSLAKSTHCRHWTISIAHRGQLVAAAIDVQRQARRAVDEAKGGHAAMPGPSGTQGDLAISWALHHNLRIKFHNIIPKKYFTSCDPHHDIYTFSYWQIFWHSIWHIFWHSIWHIFWHSVRHIFWHPFWHSFWHSIWHIFWHSIWHLFWHSSRWGPAVPTAIWKSRLRSGSAHCDLEVAVEGSAHCDLQLAVEVRQCPLGSGARGGGPAVPTGIWTARRRRRVRRRRRQRRRRRRRRTALIKSNNPHLAGREKGTEMWTPKQAIVV